MSHPALRLTPSNSPFFKNTTPRSPTKANKLEEPGLRLSKVIGSTTTSPNGFACLPSERTFAYIAGAAAVVATVSPDLEISQRFFKARPNAVGTTREAVGQWPASPTPNEPRNRALGHGKDSHGASPLGASGRDWSDSPNGRTLTAKDKVKAATSIALSPNGKWLAVGETGYKPRILIFSLAENAEDALVSTLSEHSFGVHALSFSPDSKYLASLGTINDGFLYLWQIDNRTGSATLYASNKCTTLTNCMTWIGGSLVTAGLRYLRVWRPDEEAGNETRRNESTLSPATPRTRTDNRSSEFGNSILNPRQRVLVGRNTLLGDMLEANLVDVVSISEEEAIVCTESGHICRLDDKSKAQSLTCLGAADTAISAAAWDGDNFLHVAGVEGQTQRLSLSDLRASHPDVNAHSPRRAASPQKAHRDDGSDVVGLAIVGKVIVELSVRDGVRLTNCAEDTGAISNQAPAHGDSVNGVQEASVCILNGSSFLTFSGNGSVRLWACDGSPIAMVTVPVESSADMPGLTNELKAVSLLSEGYLIAAGDKYGGLTILDVSTGSVLSQLRAHSSEITSICTFTRSDLQIVATSSRDRTIQLFAWRNEQLELLQTLDEHAGAVIQLLATDGGRELISCSADRTAVIREAVQRDDSDAATLVYGMLRAINLKSAPTSMCLMPSSADILIATTDRNLSRFSVDSGRLGLHFKCSDQEGGEAVILSKVAFTPSWRGTPAIIGISSNDKSVRLYSESGMLLARDWGHTEGITDLDLLLDAQTTDSESQTSRLVTTAVDSTIFMWDASPASTDRPSKAFGGADIQAEQTSNNLQSLRPPLRKVISHTELARLKRDTSVNDGEPESPKTTQPSHLTSPQRLSKKSSRMTVGQTPKLEPAFRSSHAESSSRRQSLKQRSPSPPSPRNRKDRLRKPSLSLPLRRKSVEDVQSSAGPASSGATAANSTFGSLTASTESACRTLRSYRKKLSGATANGSISPEALRELEKELKLTAKALSEKSHSKGLEEAMMARLLDQASEKIVGMLDERIKERVESEIRRSGPGSPVSAQFRVPSETTNSEQGEALAGALEKVDLEGK
ncbi:hypothetical protein D0863_05800 [Hortaea werneckii]|uniref:Uncharacterized protein n=1 Tax=Hortaea werneckii TaxID=91943 RepID=A0A3M7E146_HORWE|nr:hypothetical protein D0863_05800 [Hortaea werneckii]